MHMHITYRFCFAFNRRIEKLFFATRTICSMMVWIVRLNAEVVDAHKEHAAIVGRSRAHKAISILHGDPQTNIIGV